jgi:hypothetical protein
MIRLSSGQGSRNVTLSRPEDIPFNHAPDLVDISLPVTQPIDISAYLRSEAGPANYSGSGADQARARQ